MRDALEAGTLFVCIVLAFIFITRIGFNVMIRFEEWAEERPIRARWVTWLERGVAAFSIGVFTAFAFKYLYVVV